MSSKTSNTPPTNRQNTIFGCHGNIMVTMETGPIRYFRHRTLTSLKSSFMTIYIICGPWECFLAAMTTVVMVTTIWLFFRPFGPKAHLLAKFREDRAVNTRENMRRTFALYIYNTVLALIWHITCRLSRKQFFNILRTFFMEFMTCSTLLSPQVIIYQLNFVQLITLPGHQMSWMRWVDLWWLGDTPAHPLCFIHCFPGGLALGYLTCNWRYMYIWMHCHVPEGWGLWQIHPKQGGHQPKL